MRTCLIVNSKSGGWGVWQHKLQQLAAQAAVPVLQGDRDRPLTQLLADARLDGYQRIVVAGGDGTLSRVVRHTIDYLDDIELALLPTGTGNDLARSLGLFGESLEDVWQWAVSEPTVPIDLVKVSNGETHYIINAATGGFGGVVSTDVTSEDKRRWGAIAYWMTAFSKLVALEEFDVHLELDSRTVALRTYGLAIANGRYVGGGFPVAPTATLNDGLLDVTTVPVLPPMELLAAGLDFSLGRHHQTERVRTYRSSRVHVHATPVLPYSLDGEPTRSIDATFEVIPNAIQIVCGPQPAALQACHRESQIVA